MRDRIPPGALEARGEGTRGLVGELEGVGTGCELLSRGPARPHGLSRRRRRQVVRPGAAAPPAVCPRIRRIRVPTGLRRDDVGHASPWAERALCTSRSSSQSGTTATPHAGLPRTGEAASLADTTPNRREAGRSAVSRRARHSPRLAPPR